MNRATRMTAPIIVLPFVLLGCGGNRILETVLIDDPSSRHAEQKAPGKLTSNEDVTLTQAQPEFATEWSETDSSLESGATSTSSSTDTRPVSRLTRPSALKTNNDLSSNGAEARVYGDAPSADLDSEISASTSKTVRTRQARADKNDGRLNLFGEVNGIGGLPGQFPALEPIEQISYATEGADFDPSVDMTGEYLLYASTQHSDTADIYRKSIDGTTVTRLTNDPADDMMPAYSPDNQNIAFSSNRGGNWDIYVMSADGGPPVQVTSDPEHELHPSWSPDGQYIVYSRLSEASGRWEMWLTEFANPAKRRFLTYGLFPKWCPDPAQNKIVYQHARERGSRLFSIWTIDIENGEARRPTEIATAANAATVNPSWSFDGKLITFATIIDPDQQDPNNPKWADVWVIGIDGSGRANLTNGEYTNLQPCFGPDGRIYFISDRAGIDNIWALRPDDAIRTARGGERGSIGRRTSDMAEVPGNQ